VPSEAQGIWGQTFSGQVTPDGTLRAMFPSKTADDFGTIGLARRPWGRAYRDGFVVSACRGPALATLRHAYADFRLRAQIEATGPYAVCWGCRGPLGPDHHRADSTIHARMRTARIEWRRAADGWSLVDVGEGGREHTLASGSLPSARGPETVTVARTGSSLAVQRDGRAVFDGAAPTAVGRVELLVDRGVARVFRFRVSGAPAPATEVWLATEALAGAAVIPGEWETAEGPGYRFGTGFVSARAGARAKWNYTGAGFRLWAPRGPRYGRCTVRIDGRDDVTVDLHAAGDLPSVPVLERKLSRGRHAVVVLAQDSAVPLDSVEITV
jgi:hypothetical protein